MQYAAKFSLTVTTLLGIVLLVGFIMFVVDYNRERVKHRQGVPQVLGILTDCQV